MQRISKKKSEADIITPIQNNMKVLFYMGKNYFPILDFFAINIIGVLEDTTVRKKKSQIEYVFNSSNQVGQASSVFLFNY